MKKKNLDDTQLPKSLQVVLGAMSDKDRKLFGRYLQFEPFNPQQKLVDLYNLIEAHFFAAKKPPLNWEEAVSAAGINPSQIHKLLSFLHQRLDQFLGMQQFLGAPHHNSSYNLKAYDALKVDYGTTEKKWRQLHKKLHGDPLSTEHLHQMLDLEHFATKARIAAQVNVEGSYFAEMHRLIDQHYLLHKLKYCCAALNEAQLLKLPFPGALARQVQDFLRGHAEALPAFGLAYSRIFALQMEPSQPLEAYEAALGQLVETERDISREDNFDLFNYLLNLCHRRIDSGDPGFEALIVRLYGQLIALDLLTVDGEIPPRTYKNIVSINCRRGHFEWCRGFIRDHRLLLPKEDQTILPQYCMGLVHFYEGDHLLSAGIFREIIRLDPDDHFWGFESRNLLLKSYFSRYQTLSQAEHEDLYKLVDSFRMYVRRNSKLDAYHQQSYLNFIQYFSLLLRHLDQQGGTKDFPAELRKAVEEEKIVTNKVWLLKMLEEKF